MAGQLGCFVFPSRLRNISSRGSMRMRCNQSQDKSGMGKALPGGGFLLPNPMLVEAGYLYGPGRLGFAMFKNGADSKTRQTKLVPYKSGDPPVYLPCEDEATFSIDLSEGTIYEVIAEPVDERADDLKLLGSGSIAGMLPPASEDTEMIEDKADTKEPETLFIGGQSSPRRTLGCAGCNVHHKVVDHLSIVTEFRREDTDVVDMKKEIARLDRLAVTRSLMSDRMRPIDP